MIQQRLDIDPILTAEQLEHTAELIERNVVGPARRRECHIVAEAALKEAAKLRAQADGLRAVRSRAA